MPLGKTALMPSKPAKTPTKKTAGSTRQSAPKRATVATLAQDLKSLETRLKGADTKNRNALKALEGVVEDIKAAAKQSSTTQKASLTRGLNALEARMETYLERAAYEARAGVRSELANVTAAGATLSTLENAVQAAHHRLDQLDAVQRDSLARLNRHIAHLATSVEQRLTGETKARQAETAALDAKIDGVRDTLEKRVNQVEQEAAEALQAVGEKISEFATVLEDRAKTSDVDTAERLADLALETQSEFNAVQNDVTTRLEALEIIASNWSPAEPPAPLAANPYLPANADDPRIDQMGDMIGQLQEELSRVQASIAREKHSSHVAAPTTQFATAHTHTAPDNIVSMSAEQSPVQDNPYAAAARALEISSAENVQTPVSASHTPVESSAPTRDSHVPQEFDPAAFNAPVQAETSLPSPPLQTPPVPTQSADSHYSPPFMPTPPLAPPMASPGGHLPPQPELHGVEPLMPAPLPVSTYDDPAYAERDEMRAERIGGDTSKRPSLPNIPISARNLRVGALAVGVGVVGLFAANMVLGEQDDSTLQVANETPVYAPAQDSVQNVGMMEKASLEMQPVAATPPLGRYAETQTPTLMAEAENTLDAAVRAGNPIAQFQKGLVQLQAGQMEEGARLIRLAANRNQPAAQYRLAKLYESGTGIAKDEVTARELIERAARGGNRIAMHDLGNYHAYGNGGLDRDMVEALDWFTKAAERGVVDSQFNVAFLREGNEGVPTDIETALFWYHIAARQGDQGAPDRIALLSEQLDPETVADIKARADRFNPKPVDEAANGVFRNVPWATGPGRTASAASSSQSAEIIKIRDAQTLLGSLGYEVGTPDGIAGSKTRNAVKSFEAVNGLPETGQVTDELIQKLEIAAGA